MDTFPIKPNTLQQVRDAMAAVDLASAKKGLSATDKINLQTVSLNLRDMERALMESIEDRLVSELTTDSRALSDLIDQINESSKKLDKLTGILATTCKVVDAFVKVISTAMAVGLL